MDQHLRRLLIIVVLASIFSSSAQYPSSTEEDAATDIGTRTNCKPDPQTHLCSGEHPDTKPTNKAVTKEDNSEIELTEGDLPKADSSDDEPNPEDRSLCDPLDHNVKCHEPKPNSLKTAQIDDVIQEEKEGIINYEL
jgi:hypothetical protein